jgi:hypothetical protein
MVRKAQGAIGCTARHETDLKRCEPRLQPAAGAQEQCPTSTGRGPLRQDGQMGCNDLPTARSSLAVTAMMHVTTTRNPLTWV